MILRCSFEELSALRGGAESALRASSGGAGVAAPPEALVHVEALLPRLEGDLSLRSLADQRRVQEAVLLVLQHLQEQMDRLILEQYVGAEDAVNAYFDYANVLSLHERVRELGAEMTAIVELVTGQAPNERTAREISFPD